MVTCVFGRNAWSKGDLESEFLKGERGRQIVDNAAKKVKDGYVPPIVAIGKMSVKQSVDVIAYEESANLRRQ